MKKVTAEWVKKAEADHRSMTVLREQEPPVHDVVCFHAQQCAEKYLKGLMEELGLAILKTQQKLIVRWMIASPKDQPPPPGASRRPAGGRVGVAGESGIAGIESLVHSAEVASRFPEPGPA